MNLRNLSTALPLVLALANVQAAEAPKNKVLDAFDSLDPKTVTFHEVKAKVVSTPDPAHKKAIEVTADFAKPGAFPGLKKAFPPGTIDPKKYKAVRLALKSDTETEINVVLRALANTAEGREIAYSFPVKGGPDWKEAIIPFSNFVSWPQKVSVKGEIKEFPRGMKIQPEEFSQFKQLSIGFDVAKRGNASTAVVLIDGLELVPN